MSVLHRKRSHCRAAAKWRERSGAGRQAEIDNGENSKLTLNMHQVAPGSAAHAYCLNLTDIPPSTVRRVASSTPRSKSSGLPWTYFASSQMARWSSAVRNRITLPS
jgi:hypothetical protein